MDKSFEKSFERLEEILKLLNDGEISLNESLKIFEEADQIINKCSKELNDAEKKIETLVKNRENKLVLDENQKPITESFNPL